MSMRSMTRLINETTNIIAAKTTKNNVKVSLIGHHPFRGLTAKYALLLQAGIIIITNDRINKLFRKKILYEY